MPVIEDYLAAWNARDATAICACFTDTGTYEDPGTRGPIRGDALVAYVSGLWASYPDLAFETPGIQRSGDEAASFEWVMTGTNTGPVFGLPPTGKTVRLEGSDFVTLKAGKIERLKGYFDPGGVPRQLGLDIVVQPKSIGPFNFGIANMVHTGKTDAPGAYSITMLEAIDEDARNRIREGSRNALIDMLKMDGFIGATTAFVGLRGVTVSAWKTPDDSRRVMAEGAHAEAMRPFFKGELSTHGITSVWTVERPGSWMIRCPDCHRMARDPEPGAACTCGAALPDPVPYW